MKMCKKKTLLLLVICVSVSTFFMACGTKEESKLSETLYIEDSTGSEEKEMIAELESTFEIGQASTEVESTTEQEKTTEVPNETSADVEKVTTTQATTKSQQVTEPQTTKCSSTQTSMKEREKTDSLYYSKRNMVSIVYKDDGYIDIKNTILGVDFDDNAEENMLLVYDMKELVDIVTQYSNTYYPVIGMMDYKEVSYEVTYPYYDVRDYAFWSYVYNTDGSFKEFIWFYFDENFNAVYGEHPWEKYKWWGTVIPVHEVTAEEVVDPADRNGSENNEENNPNYYKKDIIDFVYNDDGSANVKDTVIGVDVDIDELLWFIRWIKEIQSAQDNYITSGNEILYETISNDAYILTSDFPYYDIRDWEYTFGDGTNNITYYWDEDFNMIQKQ